MQSFELLRPSSQAEAAKWAASGQAMFLAGGTELLNWMRIGIAQPSNVIDIGRLTGMSAIATRASGGLTIGALCTLNEVAAHPAVARDYPVLAQALLKSASPQIRNLATIGGNPLQRVRCPYFRAEEPTPCNKRVPGSGCAAYHGFHEKHAIFGWTQDCVAVQPSDPAVALAALDAIYVTVHPQGGRRIAARELHVLPEQDPARHDRLRPGELIVSIELPRAWPRSAYLKVRERESYEYATVSAAVALELDGRRIKAARIALGSVAMRPWRLDVTERRLQGAVLGSPAVAEAVAAGFSDARPLPRNAYKLTIARNAVLRTIATAAEQA